MCKYCNPKNNASLIIYDNRDRRPVVFGMYAGLGLTASLRIQDNRLMLMARSSYASSHQRYGESHGLDLDDVVVNVIRKKKIKYCPFCGRDLSIGILPTKREMLIEMLSSIPNGVELNSDIIRKAINYHKHYRIQLSYADYLMGFKTIDQVFKDLGYTLKR